MCVFGRASYGTLHLYYLHGLGGHWDVSTFGWKSTEASKRRQVLYWYQICFVRTNAQIAEETAVTRTTILAEPLRL